MFFSTGVDIHFQIKKQSVLTAQYKRAPPCPYNSVPLKATWSQNPLKTPSSRRLRSNFGEKTKNSKVYNFLSV